MSIDSFARIDRHVESARSRTSWHWYAAVTLLLAHAWAAAQASDSRADESIYRDGLLASGEPVRASVQKGLAVSGPAAACVNCHRRSGLGGSEGRIRIRPIAGRLLFSSERTKLERRWAAPAGGSGARPAYDRSSLARALREGVDPNGRELDALMPRYSLRDAEIDQLHAYLERLSYAPDPGVDEHEIHFATVITPGVDSQRRRAMLDVLQTFVRDKNGGTRGEARRRKVGTEPMYFSYRRWVLHVWELEGSPQTWGRQLQAEYRRQPVFAVVGGLGSETWEPVHAFCESAQVPCIFPDVDYPVIGGAGYYSLYFSGGVLLEAEVLAKQLARSQPQTGSIVQVFRDSETGRMVAQSLRQALQRQGIETQIEDHPLSIGTSPSPGSWARLWRHANPYTLVAWLDGTELESMTSAGAPPAQLEAIYLSGSLYARQERPQLREGWWERAHLIHLFELPAKQEQHLSRVKAWLRARQIAAGDARAQINAYFAVTLAADALSGMADNFSRDYFIERIEQMVESAPAPSMYPRLSLGPGQRFASRGGYVLRLPAQKGVQVPAGDWIVP